MARTGNAPSTGGQPFGCHHYCKNKEHHSILSIRKPSLTPFLLLTISVGTKAYSLAALAAFDAAQLPSMKSLGEECLKQIQDLQIAHWGTEHVGILQEDTIQTLIMGANRLLDFLLSMERTIIDLCQSALQVYNITLGGQACGKLLDLLENIFGYPETKANRDFEASLQPHSLLDPEEEPEVEAAIRTTDKPRPSGSTGAEATTESFGHHALIIIIIIIMFISIYIHVS